MRASFTVFIILSINLFEWGYSNDEVICCVCCAVRNNVKASGVKGCQVLVYRHLDDPYWLKIC